MSRFLSWNKIRPFEGHSSHFLRDQIECYCFLFDRKQLHIAWTVYTQGKFYNFKLTVYLHFHLRFHILWDFRASIGLFTEVDVPSSSWSWLCCSSPGNSRTQDTCHLASCVLLLFFVFICLNHLIEYYKDQISIQENPNSCMVHLYDTLLSYSIKYQVKCKDIYYLQQCNVEDCLIKCRDWSNFLILHEI